MEIFFNPDCIPFTVAIGFVIFLSIYQIVGVIFGLSVLDVPDAPDVPDFPDHSIGAVLDWLNIGRVPLVVSLILFCWIFGAMGLVIQTMLHQSVGFRLPALLLAPGVAVVSVIVLHWVIPPIARILPKDETSAIDEDWVGRTAVITIGTATAENPAEGRAQDRFGRDRYLRIVPDLPEQSFSQGTEVLIVAQKGSLHSAILPD